MCVETDICDALFLLEYDVLFLSTYLLYNIPHIDLFVMSSIKETASDDRLTPSRRN